MKPSSHRWLVLVLIASAELLAMSLWFTANAVAPQLQQIWQLTDFQAAGLTTAVQLGFVLGAAVVATLNLADIVPNRTLFVISALMAALCNLGLLVSPGFQWALLLRLLTGFFLAGVYPPAMKMVATWFDRDRGLAIGTVVGALTIGTASPYLIGAWQMDFRWVVAAASLASAVAAGLIGTMYRDGPSPFERRSFSLALVGVVIANRPTRLAVLGYLGHMWELYAMWTSLRAFLAASFAAQAGAPAWLVGLLTFAAIASGGVGCVWGGWVADKIGREKLVNLAMAVSGACCLVVGATFAASPWLVALVVIIWGFFVVADSAQFSTLVTEVAPRHAVGTALTLQTSLGFLLTTVTIQLVPLLAARISWHWAFAILALGPAAGIAAIAQLARFRHLASQP